MPKKYIFTVKPHEVSMHVRLLAKARNTPEKLAVHVEHGDTKSSSCACYDFDSETPGGSKQTHSCSLQVVIVAEDKTCLLGTISHCLTDYGSVVEADV
jgi:hypothetical protein